MKQTNPVLAFDPKSGESHAVWRLRQIIGPHGPLPVSRSHFYALIAAGKIPKPIKLGARISVWRRSDILAYIERAEASND